ncbi:head GIN domain-containing protein [Hymenobacter sp. GOD-10R]|uniref:head GIN domain-containing protein n=1 Tax=Hymenobacter sp. GOD-10R TaxID=3093922 RepID=UPI002D765552|nr:head GIN domain-containing protein [Hymenobacter sp. GOD-10R]WRQ30410.1 head GIN domain-containing protein [Hymenobacter sp. GOD-10R]
MKTTTALQLCTLTLGLGLVSCSASAQEKQTRQTGDFRAIKASGAVNIILKQGAKTSVVLEAQDEMLSHIRTEVENGTLRIYRDKDGGSLRSLLGGKSDKVVAYITTPQLTGLELSGASDVKSESVFSADHFTIKASGASDVTLGVKASTLNVEASGASDIRLTGQVESQQVHISGSSDYRASELLSKRATVEASGASDAYVSAESLSSHASGASDVHNKSKSVGAR